MLRPEKPAWQISVVRVGSMVMAIPLAGGAALVVWKLSIWRLVSQTLGIVAFLVIFVVFAVVFYPLVAWYWNRPAELAKKLPISSKELERKTKRYFDSLPK
jgi:hypothetical protein